MRKSVVLPHPDAPSSRKILALVDLQAHIRDGLKSPNDLFTRSISTYGWAAGSRQGAVFTASPGIAIDYCPVLNFCQRRVMARV